MKKSTMALTLLLAGCSSTPTTQKIPHYHPTPSIIQSSESPIYWLSDVVVPPDYPRAALINGVEGCAKIGFTIAPDGTTADPFVMQSFPEGIFDKVSIETALKLTFKPSDTNTNRVAVISSNIFTYGQSNRSFESLSAKCK
uniref:energy transducer TonB n=1 Tax=Cellvibrio fontiphilus TaxID=1815559 RepID=UPI002B4BDB83|nr:energy transducer TonB [Cellvibrio fontiphilus]